MTYEKITLQIITLFNLKIVGNQNKDDFDLKKEVLIIQFKTFYSL